jgi:hypothetical protein
MTFSPQIHFQVRGFITDLCRALYAGSSKDTLEEILHHLWETSKDAYISHLLSAYEANSGDSFTNDIRDTLQSRIAENYDRRGQGRGCPAMSSSSRVEGISVRYDSQIGMYVDKDGNRYKPDVKVTCKHCGLSQYLISHGVVKTHCSRCKKSPCDDIKTISALNLSA